MADYDIQALGLASPPAEAPVSTYYPGIRVRNNGIHPADVTGWVRVYDTGTGVLIATFNVARAAVAPGAEANAVSAQPWTLLPADIGKKFLWNGYATTPNDQVPANDPMAPTEIVVTGAVPPPPTVTSHAPQHEAGGTDELSVEGLPGVLAERQDPTDHASAHGAGGGDTIDVAGLPGVLADPQTPASHGNERHAVAFASASDVAGAIGIHDAQTTAHDDATNLEQTSRKNAPAGYAGLNLDGYAQYPQLALQWQPSQDNPMRPAAAGDYGTFPDRVAHAYHYHRTTGGVAAAREIAMLGSVSALLSRDYQAGLWINATQHWLNFRIAGDIQATPGSALTVLLIFSPDSGGPVVLASHIQNFPTPVPAGTLIRITGDAVITGGASTSPGASSVIAFKTANPSPGAPASETISLTTSGAFPTNLDGTVVLSLQTAGSVVGTIRLAQLNYVGDDQSRLE